MDRVTHNQIVPIDVDGLLVKPVYAASTALTVFNTITTDHAELHIPTVESDPEASFIDEGNEYSFGEVALGNVVVRPRKIGKLTKVTLETADDSDPAAMSIAGDALVRAIARSVDKYTFGNQAATTSAFAGLNNTAAYTLPTVTWSTATEPVSLIDSIFDAVALIESKNYQASNIVMNYEDVLLLAKSRELNTDPTQPTQRTVAGIPIVISEFVAPGRFYVVDRNAAVTVVRSDSSVEIDRSVLFTSDHLVLKARMRLAFAPLDVNGIIKGNRVA